uniref:septation protein SepH n=1 Tax=Vibrio cidicii TaxID=1763883 RepID=UPI003703C55F
MQDLKVIGVENGAIVAVGDDGERFRIAVDDTLQSKIRQVRQQVSAEAPKLSPREIQAHIRSGMSADDVAAVTGAPLDYVQRFEGPIVAEREHVVASALSVPVRTAAEVDPLGEPDTFGSVIRDRLASLGVSGERWASWKDVEAGW